MLTSGSQRHLQLERWVDRWIAKVNNTSQNWSFNIHVLQYNDPLQWYLQFHFRLKEQKNENVTDITPIYRHRYCFCIFYSVHMLGLKKLEIHYSQFWQLNLCLSAHSMALKWYVIEFFSHQIVGNNDLLVKSKSNSDLWTSGISSTCVIRWKGATMDSYWLFSCPLSLCAS